MKTNKITRRSFVGKTAMSAGMATFASVGLTGRKPGDPRSNREVWIAGVSQSGLTADSPIEMSRRVLDVLKNVVVYSPDFVCVPETFPFVFISGKLTLDNMVAVSEELLHEYSEFSRENNCYTICPVYTRMEGAVYNSAVIFDRSGKRTGLYNKIHPTEGEISDGISPGALNQPVVMTEYGPVGVQICFDINWNDGWLMLKQQGVKIIFWPSAYGGGRTVNTKAWQNKCVVASSTQKSTSKLCDITGEVITQTGIWNPNLYCGYVNLEKVFLATWPYVSRFAEIQNKYGRKVRITNFHEEEWSIIESLSPELAVKDILKEFDLKTYDEHIGSGEIIQNRTRK